ncbi:hypothetical protein [Kitasatospora azatica]|uniref:hypothetical protein n=1 Tax=Kitasatospora azatica TaxID=58347 RepID=UPI000A028E18|nr:hypothetical protein [Kitasatospora azatica]
MESYREAASALTPRAVSQFLAAHQWELEATQAGIKQIWRLRGGNGASDARIMLPLATDYVDFKQRFNDTLFALGGIHDWDAIKLYEQIVATRADLFFVRLDQAMLDGTIPFRQAELALDSLYKMMRSAAKTAENPTGSGKGRTSGSVADFLEDGMRLGHTKRGSFIFTIVSRLGDQPQETGELNGILPFPRRVMETLARGLETTRQLTQQWDESVLESPGSRGLSTGLVESLEELTKPAHLRQLDLSFEWAAAEPRPDVGLATIIMDRDIFPELPAVRERLMRQEEPRRHVTLVGTVKKLSRDDSANDDEDTALVTVAADVNRKQRLVHMTLSGADHDWAILAYQQRLPFTVSGDLSFERGAWRLTGSISVDSSFLQHHVGRDQHSPESTE